MRSLIVNVDIRPLHIRQRLELSLQLLGNVMGGLEGHVAVHDDVDFDEEARAGGVSADGVDGGYLGGVGHS